SPVTPHLYTLSLHDALPISKRYLDEPQLSLRKATSQGTAKQRIVYADHPKAAALSHTTLARWITFLGMMTASLAVGCELFMQAQIGRDTSELQSRENLVCRL